MHTNRHRHFVALPLFLLCFAAVAGVNALLPASAIGLQPFLPFIAQHDETIRSTIASLTLTAESSVRTDVMIADVQLLHGEATVETQGAARITAGDVRVVAFAGKIFVLRENDQVTVVALKNPAIVRIADGQMVLLPEHYQYIVQAKDDAIQGKLVAVPAQWFTLQNRSQKNEQRVSNGDALPTYSSTLSVDDLMSQSDSAKTSGHSQMTQYSRTDSAFLIAGILKKQFAPEQERSLLAALAQQFDPQAAILVDFVLSRLRDVHLTQLSLVLPLTLDDRQVALAIGAHAGGTDHPLSVSFVSTWETAARHMAAMQPLESVSELLPSVAGLPARFDDAGYPQYALSWRQAIDSFMAFVEPLLSSSQRVELTPVLRSVGVNGTENGAVRQSEGHASSFSMTDAQRQAIIDRVRTALLDAGAMETVYTTYDVIDAEMVRVSQISFSSKTGDSVFAFTMNASSNALSAIVRDGVVLPNTLDLQRFHSTIQ